MERTAAATSTQMRTLSNWATKMSSAVRSLPVPPRSRRVPGAGGQPPPSTARSGRCRPTRGRRRPTPRVVTPTRIDCRAPASCRLSEESVSAVARLVTGQARRLRSPGSARRRRRPPVSPPDRRRVRVGGPAHSRGRPSPSSVVTRESAALKRPAATDDVRLATSTPHDVVERCQPVAALSDERRGLYRGPAAVVEHGKLVQDEPFEHRRRSDGRLFGHARKIRSADSNVFRRLSPSGNAPRSYSSGVRTGRLDGILSATTDRNRRNGT